MKPFLNILESLPKSVCPGCKHLTLDSPTREGILCIRCGVLKQSGDIKSKNETQKAKKSPTEWICPHCNTNNFSNRNQCGKCKKYFSTKKHAPAPIEYFKQTPIDGTLTNNNCTISYKYDNVVTFYGANLIPSKPATATTHRWAFRIDNNSLVRSTIIFGIRGLKKHQIKTLKKETAGCFSDNVNSVNYGYHINAQKISRGVATNYGKQLKKNDVVVMILNLSNGTLAFEVNKKHQSLCFKVQQKPQLSYLMTVVLYKNDAVTLLKYTNDSNTNNEEKSERKPKKKTKKNKKKNKISAPQQIATLKKEIQKLKNEMNSSQSQSQSAVSGIMKQMEHLQRENKRLSDEYDISRLKLSHKIQKLTKENGILNDENHKLKNKVYLLQDEQKEFVIENKNLKHEIQELKLKHIDCARYLEWNCEEIVGWILSLEGSKYCKYEGKLKIELKEEGVNGKNLSRINEMDIKGWGVKNVDDRKDLFQAIQKLINQNINEGTQGSNASTYY